MRSCRKRLLDQALRETFIPLARDAYDLKGKSHRSFFPFYGRRRDFSQDVILKILRFPRSKIEQKNLTRISENFVKLDIIIAIKKFNRYIVFLYTNMNKLF